MLFFPQDPDGSFEHHNVAIFEGIWSGVVVTICECECVCVFGVPCGWAVANVSS